MKNRKLVMIPGPTPVARSIQDEMGRDTVSFKDAKFMEDFKGLVEDLKTMWKTEGQAFVVAGTGTMSMEMAIANTTKKDDNILIVSHGYFGDRFIDICKRKGLNVDVISSEWGKIVPVKDIENKLKEKNYSAITVTHVDTSTGTKAPVEEIGKIVKNFEDTLLIVDGVCSVAAEREYIDDMGIDVLFTASQKAFGVSPGLAILWAGPKALKRRESLGNIPESYIDFNKWLPIMKDPTKYWGTPPINLIWALQESVRLIKEEGLENRFDRHIKDAEAMRKAVKALGFKILAEEGNRAVTLSNCIYPEGVKDEEFRKNLAEEGAVVAGGLGEYAGKLFRLGHMGNIDKHILVSTIAAIERASKKSGMSIELGSGLKALQEEIL